MSDYHVPVGGLPSQSELMTGRAVFTDAYAVIPKGCQSDIVTSFLPNWTGTRAWILARPLSGFAETFSQYILEVQPGGGSGTPETDPQAQAILFVVSGLLSLEIAGQPHTVGEGGYVYIPSETSWTVENVGVDPASFHWFRKRYEPVEGIEKAAPFVSSDQSVEPVPMPDTDGVWATSRFVEAGDMAHDMEVNIVTFQPGGVIPFEETHVMEHGIYVLEGKAVYKLNSDWVEVEAGDFMWLRAFCPQACYAAGPGPFRYLLYKDVNRHARLGGVLG